MQMMKQSVCAALLVPLLFVLSSLPARAQDLSPRYGIGLNGLVSSEDGLGIGFLARASAPVNRDLSIAIDLGATGFILGGTEDAISIFTPQLSAIVNLPVRGGRLTYLLGGVGAHVPLTRIDDSATGPTIHAGIGRVQTLTEASVFYEINPALLVGEKSVDLLVPVRVGIIF